MIKYARIINTNTGEVEVGQASNAEYYKSIGMSEMDVSQSDVDGNWYLAEKCPMKSDDEKAQERKAEFEKQFFNIEGVGYYRRQPKGYSSALESVNTAFNAVSIMGKLPENTLTFYKAPDFTIEEQCTEEWLVANSFKNAEMTAQEFGQFYASFITAWNMQEHL
jgi:hypothetical protein